MHNYFGIGLRAKLAEMKMKQEALAADAGLNSKTVQRAINEEVDERSKQLIADALGTTIEKLELIGRSRALGRIWVAPDSEKGDVYELPEILDAHNLFRALSGKITAFQITRPTVVSDQTKHDAAFRTDFERLTKLQGFLLSLMLLAPADPIYAMSWDPMDWDRQLEQIDSLGYRLFIGPAGVGRRALAFVQTGDLAIRENADRTRVYLLDLTDPFEAEDPLVEEEPG